MEWTGIRKRRYWLQWLTGVSFALVLWASMGGIAYAQLEDFETFNGSGFSPTPATGQLDSDTWIVTGFSGGSLAFGDTGVSGDFARGTSNGGVGTGGVYAFGTGGNSILGVQPVGNDFTPGTIQLRRPNETGSPVTDVTVSYNIWTYNDQGRSNSLNFAWSISGTTTFTDVQALDYATPEAADPSPAWTMSTRSTTIAVNLDPDDTLCLRWTGDDVSGSGSRDEYGIDNVYVSLEAPTLVELVRFETSVEKDDVILTWETGAEIDVAGFNLYRSHRGADEDARINERLIGPRGISGQGSTYTFRDRPGEGVFEYWLEDLDTAGIATLHGPVTVSTVTDADTPASHLFLPVIYHP